VILQGDTFEIPPQMLPLLDGLLLLKTDYDNMRKRMIRNLFLRGLDSQRESKRGGVSAIRHPRKCLNIIISRETQTIFKKHDAQSKSVLAKSKNK